MISIIIPSVRDYRWKDILEEFNSTATTDFEIIVCGPCSPQDLGPKFKAIQTDVKAAQCVEIAVRQSKGEYLFFTPDDVIHTPNILDVFLAYRLSCKDDLIIISPRFQQIGVTFAMEAHLFSGPGTPICPVSMFMSRKDWDAIGGVDRNFVVAYWAIDVSMRCYAMGGRVDVLPDAFMNEILPTLCTVGQSNLNASFHKDLPYLFSLWTNSPAMLDGKLNVTRAKPFEPFCDEGILEIDQGTQETQKGISQGFDASFSDYIRTGRGPGYPNRVPLPDITTLGQFTKQMKMS